MSQRNFEIILPRRGPMTTSHCPGRNVVYKYRIRLSKQRHKNRDCLRMCPDKCFCPKTCIRQLSKYGLSVFVS